jgi:hypothetical protein
MIDDDIDGRFVDFDPRALLKRRRPRSHQVSTHFLYIYVWQTFYPRGAEMIELVSIGRTTPDIPRPHGAFSHA